MEARAQLNYARISPRKITILLDLIRKQPVDKAKAILKHTPKAGCEYLIKLLDSAVALRTTTIWMLPSYMSQNASYARAPSSRGSVRERRAARLRFTKRLRT